MIIDFLDLTNSDSMPQHFDEFEIKADSISVDSIKLMPESYAKTIDREEPELRKFQSINTREGIYHYLSKYERDDHEIIRLCQKFSVGPVTVGYEECLVFCERDGVTKTFLELYKDNIPTTRKSIPRPKYYGEGYMDLFVYSYNDNKYLIASTVKLSPNEINDAIQYFNLRPL